MSERAFRLRVDIDPFRVPSREALMDALDETIRRESRARGITPNRFARAPGDDANRGPFNILVFGDRDESEGWDADGSPTSEWPDLSLPWGPS